MSTVKGFPDESAKELVQRLRDGLIELLGKRTGGLLHDRVDGISVRADRAADTFRDAEERGRQQIPAGGPEQSPADSRRVPAVGPEQASPPLEKDASSPVAGSRDDGQASDRGQHFVLKLTQGDREAFASLADKLSLYNMVGDAKLLASFEEMRGKKFSAEENRLIGLLDNMRAEQGGKLIKMNLEFRWVSAEPGLGVPKLVEDARVHGGSEPNRPWTHIGGGVVEDFMGRNRDAGVLFIYDGDKLRAPTEEERKDPNGKNMFMYAKKPIDGLELKDALLGMIRFDPAGD
ncbi:hypothetical protein ABZV91_28060 [Nocardia sp. NPDC004568]|uniref:hypothetical protein n=1 Tax=Nocardia sp. NPDC004568 TaxID=3154551 RepID=UPI0033B6989E